MLKDCEAAVIGCKAASFHGVYAHGVIDFAFSSPMHCGRERSARCVKSKRENSNCSEA